MAASYFTLPSGEAMEEYCHLSPDRLLPQQTLALLLILTCIACLVFCIPAAVAGAFSFVSGAGIWNEDPEALGDWARTTVNCGLACAATIIALGVFIRTYVRSQFGKPSFFMDLETELPKETVMEICHAYLIGQDIEPPGIIEESRNRIIGLVKSAKYARTYVEIRAVTIDDHTTRIVVRTASVTYGRASLFSAFYSDLGAAKKAATQLISLFSAYASRRRRTTGQWSRQVRKRMKPAKYCPPPSLKVRQVQ